MTTGLIVAAAFRWLGLVAQALLVGSLVVEAFAIPGGAPEADATCRRLARVCSACAAALLLASAAELVVRAQTMTGGAVAAALSAIPAVLTRTHFGLVWTARLALLLVALLVSFAQAHVARRALLALALGATLTTSLTGHAADRGDLTLSVAIDWAHVLSVSAWAGGVIALALALPRAAAAWPSPLLGAVMRRFSRLAGACLGAAILTGGYAVWIQVPRPSALWTTGYGRALAVKLALVAAAVACGALVRYTVLPRLGGEAAGTPLRRRLWVYIGREAALMVLVLGATAVLVDATPARHAEHATHRPMRSAGPFRVTMEDLHEGGGVPKGWIFTPPAGDPARGRQVFAKLGCAACHKIGADEGAPSGVGPDLDGVGQHHPAGYILESILNPNAVVVEASGYTTPDGKSIMPDYRAQLSASDLIDLVAYLQTL